MELEVASQVDKGRESIPVLCRGSHTVDPMLCRSAKLMTEVHRVIVGALQCAGHSANVCTWLSLCVRLGPAIRRSRRAEEVSKVGLCVSMCPSINDLSTQQWPLTQPIHICVYCGQHIE